MYIIIWGCYRTFNFYDWGDYMSFLKTMINSIARTFGRILAYVLIGIAIYFIASKVHASPQYRVSQGSWGEWTNVNVDTDYQFVTNLNSSWSSYIQLKDTVAFDDNKTYNLNANLEFILNESGTKDMNSALDPYIYNGTTLTNASDKCTITGTRSDKTSSSPLVITTHTYKVNVNCVGLKNVGYYPYLTIRFLTNGSSVPTNFTFNVKSWEYHVGSDSTDANNIMNNNNQNTQTIVENNNSNTESIINNQNENTTQVIEALENQNKVCNDNIIYTLNADTDGTDGKLDNNGNISSQYQWKVSDYLRADATYTTILNLGIAATTPNLCFYTENKTLISCEAYNGRTEITVLNPVNTYYIRASYITTRTTLITTSYCYDYREKETEQNEEIVDNLHNMLTLIQSDDSPSESNISSAFGGVNLTDETPFTNLLMFPVLIFSYFSNSMSNTCSPVVLGSLYGHELSLPCLNLPNYLGLTLWNIIDLLFVFYMIYNIAHLFIGILEDITELRSPFLRFFIKNRGVVNHD